MLDSSFRDLSDKLSLDRDNTDAINRYERWESAVKGTISKLPYMDKILSGKDYCVFGSFLQTIYENPELSPEQLIELHFITLKKDLDIRCFVDDIVTVFRKVFDAGGSVEFAGTPYCTKVTRMSDRLRHFSNIDLRQERYGIPEGNYWIYIKHKDGWIKYDVSYRIKKPDIRLDFVANGLVYPCSNDVERTWNLCAMVDIRDKRIVPIQEILTPKIMFRATKLTSRGYQFQDIVHLERMVSRKKAYYPSTVLFGSTDVPSTQPTNPIIVPTKHNFSNPNREDLPEYYSKFVKEGVSICGSSFKFGKMDWRECTGSTTQTVIVYRPAVITNKGTKLEWTSYETKDKDDQYAVIVKLQISANTKLKSINCRTCIMFKFYAEDIVVKDIFGYYDRSVFDKVMTTLKKSPFSMDKRHGYITTESDNENYLYISTAWAQCTDLRVMTE